MSTQAGKPLISVSVIGHVDSGKSTLTGRLATVFGDYDTRAQEKMAKIAADYKKESFNLAYYTDKTEQERKRGVTINTTLVEMQTKKFRINFLDCPGHADYIKNAISGCKQSDLSVVVVPADFQASCSSEGTLGTHITLASVLSSKNFIVCINKLDEVAEKNSSDLKTTFDAACAAVAKLLKKVGVDNDKTIFLPVSALRGVGLFEDGETFPFYKGSRVVEKPAVEKPAVEKPAVEKPAVKKPVVEEPKFVYIKTLEEAINYQDAPVRPVTRPLRMPLSNVAHVAGHGAIFCGRIDYGSLKKGDSVKFLPTTLVTDIKNVQEHRKDIDVGEAGMNVGFSVNFKDKIQIDKINTGHIVGPANDNEFAFYPFYVAKCISLKPKSKGGEERGIRPGYTPVLSGGTANVACKFVKILDYTTKNGTVENPAFVPNGARFTVLIYPTKPVLFEAADKLPFLGKFICRDSGIIVAAGQIHEHLTEEEAVKKHGVNMTEVLGQKPVAAEGKKKKK